MGNKNTNNNPEKQNIDTVNNSEEKEIVVDAEIVKEPEVEKPDTIPEPETTNKPVIGVVSNCVKLNIRKKPQLGAEVMAEVAILSKLMIDEGESTDDWFKICTETGIEGFCMKKFVAVNK